MMANRAIKYFIFSVLICSSVLFVCTGCRKSGQQASAKKEFETDKFYQRGPLAVHIRLDKNKINIAQTVLLELEAAVQPGYEVQMPKVDKVLENFGIVNWSNPGDRLDPNNNIVRTNQYRLEPFLSGTFPIPAFTFEFWDANDPNDKKYELATEPVDVEVAGLLGEDRSKLTIADIENVVEIRQQASFWWVWVVITLIILSAAGSWLYLRRKRIEKLVRILKPAHEIAYERLRLLVNDDLITAGRIKEFYERISDILRHYIEHRFELRAPERTTEEFLAELRFTDMLSAPDKESLGEFLNHCDLVKFAKHEPTAQQVQRTFDLVRDFIDKTKSEDHQIDVTDNLSRQETVRAGSM